MGLLRNWSRADMGEDPFPKRMQKRVLSELLPLKMCPRPFKWDEYTS